MLNNQYILMDTKPEIDGVLFCGGGGADTGIEQATGTPIDFAINHDSEAIGMHAVNHPQTVHFKEDVFAVHPLVATRGRPVRILWASPDCTHFSIAKGGKPVEKKIRSLAWVVVKYAKTVRPRIIYVENVKEFQTWGPLGSDNRPDKSRSGETFNKWVNELKKLGYEVEWRVLSACDFGAPTSRKRLFLIARCDGQPIVWPEPTHGDPENPETKKNKLKPWRTAAEIIDWTIPCPSIFERKKPLSENTLRRIAKGIQKFIINNPKPFIVQVNHHGESYRGQTLDEPITTVTGKNGYAVVSPTLINIGYGDKDGKRVPGLDVPLGTITAGGKKHALVSAFLSRQYGQSVGTAADTPLGTITRIDHNSLVTSYIVKMRGTNIGQNMEVPLQTISAQGKHFAEVRALLIKYGADKIDDFKVYVDSEPYAIVDIGLRMLQPHELFAAQGFPTDYIYDRQADGTPITKTAQVAKCGNAVCPPVAKALVAANLSEPDYMEKAI